MFQRDWLMRQIQSLAQVIATYVFQLKQEKKHDEALQVLEELYGRINVPKSALLLNLSDAELLRLLSANGVLNLEKTISTAILLKEEAEVYTSMGREAEDGYRRNVKSLFLLLTAEEEDGEPPSYEYREAISELYGRLRAYDFPLSLLAPLALHFERHGVYAFAEDVWFELADRGADCHSEGRQFFERLLEKSDSALAEGGLPRDEVLEGLRDWNAKAES